MLRYRAWIVVAVALLVFAPSLGPELLHWDDRRHLALNPGLVSGDWLSFWLRPYFGLYVPVTYTVWTALWAIAPTAYAFHALSLGLHALNSWLVLRLLERLELTKVSALAGALFFAVHPLQAETVSWISSGRDLLSAAFGLGSLLLLSRGLGHPATLLFILGCLAKPTLVVLPLAAYFILDKSTHKWLAAWLLVSVSLGAYVGSIQASFTKLRLESLGVFERAHVALDSLGFYTVKIFWPFGLSADYGRVPDQAGWIYPAAALLIAALLTWRKRWKPAAFATTMLLPVLGLVPFAAQFFSLVADRYVYLSMAGVALLVGPLFVRYRSLAILLIAFAGASMVRASTWRTNEGMLVEAISNNPNSYMALTNYAIVNLERGELASAKAYLERAIPIRPKLAVAPANLAQVLWLQNKPDEMIATVGAFIFTPGIVEYNAHEPAALALAYEMLARAYAATGNPERANVCYCNLRFFDSAGADRVRSDILRATSEATVNCP